MMEGEKPARYAQNDAAHVGAGECALRYAHRVERRCPVCGKLSNSETNADFPFCSERCRLLDLGNWSSEKYVISEPAFDESMFEDLERDLSSSETDGDE
jgi:hypothetical protein